MPQAIVASGMTPKEHENRWSCEATPLGRGEQVSKGAERTLETPVASGERSEAEVRGPGRIRTYDLPIMSRLL